MKWLHTIFGLGLFVIFAITGSYMRADFPDKDLISPALRLLMRSRHIYILFSALIHISLGVYMRLGSGIGKVVQIAGSLLLVAASALLIEAWRVETYDLQHFSDVSRWGIYLSLAGVGLHLIGGVGGGVSSKQ